MDWHVIWGNISWAYEHTPAVPSAITAAIGVFLTCLVLFYSTKTLATTKRLDRVRVTLGQLDSEDFKKAVRLIHDFLKAHGYNLSRAREDADRKWETWYLCAPDCEIEETFVATFHPITHLSTLFAANVVDRNTVLDRHALLFARYYYVFYTYLESLQVQGDQTGSALVLGRYAIDAVLRRPSELKAENPELAACYIPGLVNERTATPSTVRRMRELRARRWEHLTPGTANTSSAAPGTPPAPAATPG
jgi:hypothetical protein